MKHTNLQTKFQFHILCKSNTSKHSTEVLTSVTTKTKNLKTQYTTGSFGLYSN